MFKIGHQRWRERLSEYIDDRLEARRRAELERHLETCASCREELATLRTTVEVLRHLPSVVPTRSFVLSRPVAAPVPQWFEALRLATAVAAFLLVAVISLDLVGLLYLGSAAGPISQPSTAGATPYRQAPEAERGLKDKAVAPAAAAAAVAPTPTLGQASEQKAAGEVLPKASPSPAAQAPVLPTPTPAQVSEEKAAEGVVPTETPVAAPQTSFTTPTFVEGGLLLATLALLALTLWRGRLERRL